MGNFDLQVVQKHQTLECNQKISSDGKIIVKKRGWILRFGTLTGLILIMVYNIEQGLLLGSSLIVYSTLMPLHTFLVLIVVDGFSTKSCTWWKS